MFVGLVFAMLAVLCGLAVNRALGAPLSVAPFSGLACIAVMSSWCVAVGAPPAPPWIKSPLAGTSGGAGIGLVTVHQPWSLGASAPAGVGVTPMATMATSQVSSSRLKSPSPRRRWPGR